VVLGSVVLAGMLGLFAVAAWAHEPADSGDTGEEIRAALTPALPDAPEIAAEASAAAEAARAASTMPAGDTLAGEQASVGHTTAVIQSQHIEDRGESAAPGTGGSASTTSIQQVTRAGQVEIGPVPPGAVRRTFLVCLPADPVIAQAIGQFIAGRSFSATLRALPNGCAELILDVNTADPPSVQGTSTQTSILSVTTTPRGSQASERITVQISTTGGTTTAVISNTVPQLDLTLPEPSRRALEGLRHGDRSDLRRFLDELLRNN
jgi:hypothetical protein